MTKLFLSILQGALHSVLGMARVTKDPSVENSLLRRESVRTLSEQKQNINTRSLRILPTALQTQGWTRSEDHGKRTVCGELLCVVVIKYDCVLFKQRMGALQNPLTV